MRYPKYLLLINTFAPLRYSSLRQIPENNSEIRLTATTVEYEHLTLFRQMFSTSIMPTFVALFLGCISVTTK